MSEFKAINTQEELDNIIQDRLKRQKEVFEKKIEEYGDYDELKKSKDALEKEVSALKVSIEDSNEKSKTYDDTVADLNSKISEYETQNLRTRIAIKNDLPLDLVDRLTGTDEESINADAEKLSSYFKKTATMPPLKDTEPPLGEGKDGAYKNLLNNLNLKGE